MRQSLADLRIKFPFSLTIGLSCLCPARSAFHQKHRNSHEEADDFRSMNSKGILVYKYQNVTACHDPCLLHGLHGLHVLHALERT